MSQLLHSKILGQGAPLIILHGLLGMGDNWLTLGRQYAQQGFQVHLIDMRNHGKSFHHDEMTYEAMSRDLKYYLDQHQLNTIDLIGHSMGGKAAMFFCLQYPELIKHLIVVDIAPKFYPPHHHFIFEAINHLNLQKFTKRQAIEKELSQYVDSDQIVKFILKNLARDKYGHFYWKANISVLEKALRDLGEAMPPNTVINCLTLFIKGAQSPYILREDENLIKAHFPHSEIVVIQNSSHWVHAQQARLFYQITLNFLKS